MIYLPDGRAHAPEYQDLAHRITYGDNAGWVGDPRLWLGIGVIEEKATGKTMRRLEVWRHNEDGTDTIVGHWHPSEAGQITRDLAEMRLGRPGAVSVLDRIDAHNEKKEEEAAAQRRDALAQRLERDAYRLMLLQGHARNRFAVDGLRKDV